MRFENNFKNTSNILDKVEKNLKSHPNYKIISNLMSELNKNLAEYKFFLENKMEKNCNSTKTILIIFL